MINEIFEYAHFHLCWQLRQNGEVLFRLQGKVAVILPFVIEKLNDLLLKLSWQPLAVIELFHDAKELL